MRVSLGTRIIALVCANAVVDVGLAIVAARLPFPLVVTASAAVAVALLLAVVTAQMAVQRVTRTLMVVSNGVRGLRERDFSLRLTQTGNDEMSELIGLYNEVAEVLRSQRSDLYQRELLLDTILQGSPIAVVLANPADRVVFANVAARDLLGGGKRFDGRRFSEVALELPPAMREILQAGEESIFSVGSGDHDETFHYVRRTFYLNTQRHTLTLIERLTPELRRQELAVWKRVIRTIDRKSVV